MTDDRVASAGLNNTVERAREVVADWSMDLRAALEQSRPGMVRRIDALLTHTSLLIESAPNELVPIVRINSLNQLLETLIQHARSADPNGYQIDYLDRSVEDLATELSLWPDASTENWRSAVSNAASFYRRSLGQQLTSFNADLKSLQDRIVHLQSETSRIDQEGQSIAAQRSQLIEQEVRAAEERANALAASIKRVNDQLDGVSKRIDQQVTRHDTEFNNGQVQRQNDFDSATGEQKREAEIIIDDIRSRLDEAGMLTAFLAGGVTGNAYRDEANSQAITANWLRGIAVALGVLAGGAALWLAHDASAQTTISWQSVTSRLALSVLLAGLASYMATQSQRHRRREEEARHTELRLAAFDPFVRELSDQERVAARTQLATSIFAAPALEEHKSETPVLTEQHVSLVQKLIEAVLKR